MHRYAHYQAYTQKRKSNDRRIVNKLTIFVFNLSSDKFNNIVKKLVVLIDANANDIIAAIGIYIAAFDTIYIY